MIEKGDRVSKVLRQDESLIEVFVSVSPAFEKLRNPRMRKVMSRLVTVEQAARVAQVDVDELLRRLNSGAAVGPVEGTTPTLPADPYVPTPRPAVLGAISQEQTVEVDVREELRAGKEPFSRIMASRREVPDGGALCVRATFEPVPLYQVMAAQGLDHHTERLAEEDWRVWFYAAPDRAPSLPVESEESHQSDLEGLENVLDVRGLEPPEPMLRTLAALEELPPGGVLTQVNVRVPAFLLPLLDERGFTYEIREAGPELVYVVIHTSPDPVHVSVPNREEKPTDA